jgi:hypothetical protein
MEEFEKLVAESFQSELIPADEASLDDSNRPTQESDAGAQSDSSVEEVPESAQKE